MQFIITIIIGVLLNYLLLYHDFGIGMTLSMLTYLFFVTYAVYKKEGLHKEWAIKSLILILLSLTYFLRTSPVFMAMTFIMLPFLYGAFFVKLSTENLFASLFKILTAAFRPIASLHCFIRDLISKAFKGREKAKAIVLGTLIALPFLAVVIPLLVSSDMVFKNLLESFFKSLEFSANLVFRVIFFLLIASYSYAQFLYPMIKTKADKDAQLNNSSTDDGIKRIEGIEGNENRHIMAYTFLGIINIIYGLFVFIQVNYLFINKGGLPKGVTYADYAREGFFQLLAVVIINILLIIGIEIFNKEGLKVKRILSSITLIMTLVMSISSYYRMSLYEASYGYTNLRLLVFMFLIFLMGFILLMITYLTVYKKVFLNLLFIYMLIYYIGASLFNIDGYVAERNIERYEQTGQMDWEHVFVLSLDAYPQIISYIQEHPEILDQIPSYEAEIYWLKKIKLEEKISWQEWSLPYYKSKMQLD